MIPLLVLVSGGGVGLALGALGVKRFRDWGDSLRYALALMFLVTASAHWGSMRPDLVRMVPPVFPNPELLVTMTGIFEILGAIGLLIPRFARFAAWALTLLLLSVFPANVHAAHAGLTIAGEPVLDVLPRAAVQLVFLAATITSALRSGRSKAARATPRGVGPDYAV
jgi:uncharacterized membrane protein